LFRDRHGSDAADTYGSMMGRLTTDGRASASKEQPLTGRCGEGHVSTAVGVRQGNEEVVLDMREPSGDARHGRRVCAYRMEPT
jgi:hypothetical protein